MLSIVESTILANAARLVPLKSTGRRRSNPVDAPPLEQLHPLRRSRPQAVEARPFARGPVAGLLVGHRLSLASSRLACLARRTRSSRSSRSSPQARIGRLSHALDVHGRPTRSLHALLCGARRGRLARDRRRSRALGANARGANALGANARSANALGANARSARRGRLARGGRRSRALGANARGANALGANARSANALGANARSARRGRLARGGRRSRALGANSLGANARGANALGANARSARRGRLARGGRRSRALGANARGANARGANARSANALGANARSARRGRLARGGRRSRALGANSLGANARGANALGANARSARRGRLARGGRRSRALGANSLGANARGANALGANARSARRGRLARGGRRSRALGANARSANALGADARSARRGRLARGGRRSRALGANARGARGGRAPSPHTRGRRLHRSGARRRAVLGPIASLAAATAAAAHSRYPRRRADAPAVRGAGRSDKGRLSRGRRQPKGNACTRTREVHRGATSRERARERSMALCAGHEEHRLPVVLVVHVQVRARVQQQVDAPHPLAHIPRRVREHARARHLQRGLPPIFGARLGVAPEPQQMTHDLLLPKKDSVGQDGTRSDGCGAEIQGFEGQMAVPKAAGVAAQEQCGHHLRATMQDGIAKGPRLHPEDHALLAPPKEDTHHDGGLRVGARRVNRRDQSPRAHLQPVADHRVVDTLVAGRRHQRLQADGIASADGSMKLLVEWHRAVLEQQGQRGRAPRLERGVDARLQLLQGSARAAGERKQERRQKGPVSSGHDELEGSHVLVGTRVGSARDVQARRVPHHQVRCNGGVVEGARQREEGQPVGRLYVGRHTHLVDEKTHTLRGAKRDGRREKRAADDAAVIVVRWKLRHCEDGVVHQGDVDPRVAGRAQRRSDGHVSVRTSLARQGSDDENATRPRWIAVTTRAKTTVRERYVTAFAHAQPQHVRAKTSLYCVARIGSAAVRPSSEQASCCTRTTWTPSPWLWTR